MKLYLDFIFFIYYQDRQGMLYDGEPNIDYQNYIGKGNFTFSLKVVTANFIAYFFYLKEHCFDFLIS